MEFVEVVLEIVVRATLGFFSLVVHLVADSADLLVEAVARAEPTKKPDTALDPADEASD